LVRRVWLDFELQHFNNHRLNGRGEEDHWPRTSRVLRSYGKTNMEKITNEMLAALSENSSDSESFDVESGNEDVEDQPWRPSHVVFGKSTIKQG
jgi:hypothetical protein